MFNVIKQKKKFVKITGHLFKLALPDTLKISMDRFIRKLN